MDKFALLLEGRPAGELTAEPEGLYTCFTADCRRLPEGLWCAWAVGDQGQLRLGILEPEGDRAVIRRRFSGANTRPLGRLQRGEIRPAEERPDSPWQPAPPPEQLFPRSPWLRQRLQGHSGGLFRREGELLCLALPYDAGRPFPLPTLFCFASIRLIGAVPYAVFRFDRHEHPTFP